MVNTGTGGTMPTGSTNIGQNLMNDHPVSFEYTNALAAADGELVNPESPGAMDPLRLFPGVGAGDSIYVQCTTCHDAHTDQQPKFLRKSLTGQSDNLCLTCHDKPGWTGSTHQASTTLWPSTGTLAVRDHSCSACHTPHTQVGAERLLRDGASGGESAIEETCYQCHQPPADGGVAPDILSEFNKSYSHPILEAPGTHDPVFTNTPAEPVALNQRHVECVDCHNPHRVSGSNRTEGIRGIGIDGSQVENVVNEPAPQDGLASDRQYPLCLRCHGDTYLSVIGSTTQSGVPASNKRLEFQTSNSSFHPVAGPGKNNSANLNAQLTGNGLSVSSVIRCTDCHNSNAYSGDAGRVDEGTAPIGPHGSQFPSILRANFWSTLPGPSDFSASNFDLCFRCHTQNRLMARRRGDGARTNFYDDDRDENLHWVHLDDRSDKTGAICKTCHYNIHSNEEAANTQYNIDGVIYNSPPPNIPTRLVNFHPNITATGTRSRPEWRLNTGTRSRSCFLRCHGSNGSPGGGDVMNFSYRPPSGDLTF
jgi:predicted CXXCH cytochrome family protein